MADGIVQVAPDSTGKKVDTAELTVGSNTVERQRVVLADNATAAAVASVNNAQPAAADYALAVRQAGDNNPVLNGATFSSATTIYSADVAGYQSFQFQVQGTFVATIVIEGSNDNTNWNGYWWYSTVGGIASSITGSANSVQGMSSGNIRTRYLRVRVSSFTSSASGAVTLILRNIPLFPEYINVAVQTMPTASVGPAAAAPTAGVGATQFIKSTATTNATSVKNGAGNLFCLYLVNNSAAVKYFKFYNKASAPTVGTDTPVAVIGIPASGNNFVMDGPPWVTLRFSTGIAYAITGAVADSDTTAVAVNDVSGWMIWA